jgi:hypothetical protein
MNKTDDKPIILTKRKNIQIVLDYCLDQKISFNANPRAISIDEWEVELDINNIKGAIALGIFIRENKLEIYGMGTPEVASKPKQVTPVVTNNKKVETKEPVSAANLVENAVNTAVVDENNTPTTLSFDLNNSNN